MRTYFTYLILCLFPVLVFAQQKDVIRLTDSSFSKTGIRLTRNPGYEFLYHKGDNPDWAQPSFDDSKWSSFPMNRNRFSFKKAPILNRGELAWFRAHIQTDSTLDQTVIMRIRQFGASEIYLDGRLIHRLGEIGNDAEDMVFRDPFKTFFDLPLKQNHNHLLAIRYRHDPPTIPIFVPFDNYFLVGINSLENATSKDPIKNPVNEANAQIIAKYNIVLGLSLLMFIIFLSYYLFFPRERINGYFSLANFFLVLFALCVLWNYHTESGYRMLIVVSFCVAIMLSHLILLYCIYKILNVSIDRWFKVICGLAGLSIIGFIFYLPDIITPIWALFMYLAIIRVSYRAHHSHKVASSLFIGSSIISLLFWLFFVLQYFTSLPLTLVGYEAFVFMLNPIVLAIYLGYAFGRRSQDLRHTLDRVQKLSSEKESILSRQKEILEQKVKERTESLNQSLEDLKNTQAQLVQSEKMASLGELTAGIAHEIQNPLNFVNNFSEVSHELIDEMNEELEKGDLEEVKAISKNVKDNLEKITYHGKRADAIVKGMLQHSRNDAGNTQPTDLNKLTDEFMRLAYHGFRAKDKSFNVHLVTRYNEEIGLVEVVPQDIGRVILNLFTNAFYAVAEKQKAKSSTDYTPEVIASTTKTDSEAIIKVRDNGNGIPEKIKNKIFEPFFTTKPAGQGTGLGLSMSYEMIKMHDGEIIINTVEGEWTEFEIHLPLKPILKRN